MSYKAKLLGVCASVLMVAACAPVDPGFGEALRYDMAVQTIDPDPVYKTTDAKPGDNGEKAAKATERYRKGTTKPVRRESVSGGGSGGGGGSSSGGGGPG